jgi:hypothetical protein
MDNNCLIKLYFRCKHIPFCISSSVEESYEENRRWIYDRGSTKYRRQWIIDGQCTFLFYLYIDNKAVTPHITLLGSCVGSTRIKPHFNHNFVLFSLI